MDFHILTQADDQKTVQAVFHLPVPSINNTVGINYQTALVQYLTSSGPITSKVASPGELTAMQAGSLYELPVTIRWSRLGLTSIQQLAEVNAYYQAKKSEILASLSSTLAFWGYTANAT